MPPEPSNLPRSIGKEKVVPILAALDGSKLPGTGIAKEGFGYDRTALVCSMSQIASSMIINLYI